MADLRHAGAASPEALWHNARTMLFFLTGDIQIGKTRWLQGVVDDLGRAGVTASGVIAPGRWAERPGGFEKLGIDNVLLPQVERLAFAEPGNPGWKFDEAAIGRVDRHLAGLLDGRNAAGPGLLVIDELGWMELQAGSGLVSAMRLLDAGACPAFPHAVVIVRDRLLPLALERFENADWGGTRILRPDAPSRETLLAAFGVDASGSSASGVSVDGE